MRIAATFVRSAAVAGDFPRDGTAEIALVGRSNVGKSTLINALVRRRVARVSAAPGKTRLANIYRVARTGTSAFYLVDLPGYGFASGGPEAAREFDEVTRAYFGREERERQEGKYLPARATAPAHPAGHAARIAALLVVDARHPGLTSDRHAWQWLHDSVAGGAIVATKIDKLARGERIRALRELESVLEHPVVAVSAVTGEGLDQLWKVIDKLTNNSNNNRRDSSSRLRRSSPPRATAPHRRKN